MANSALKIKLLAPLDPFPAQVPVGSCNPASSAPLGVSAFLAHKGKRVSTTSAGAAWFLRLTVCFGFHVGACALSRYETAPTARCGALVSSISSGIRRSTPFRFAALCASRENRAIAAVVGACAVFLVWKAVNLRYGDLVFGYPFVTFDSFQWMVDSLFYRGREVDAFYRNPGLPLVLALLGVLGRTGWLPLVTVGLTGVFVMYLVLLLRRHFAPVPAAIALLLIFFNFNVQTAFDYVLADQWAVTFQLAALYHLLEAAEDPAHLRPFAVWSAISFLFQYAIAALAPACLFYALLVLRPRATDIRRFDRNLLAGVGLALLVVGPMFIYKIVRFGDPIHSGVVQFKLIAPHFFGVVFYAVNALGFYGVLTTLVMTYGFGRTLQDRGGAPLLINSSILSYFAFWVLLYIWLDPRFLLYFAPFAAFCLARGLSDLRIEAWLGRAATFPRAAVGWGALGFALLCGLYERSDPYARNEIPLTPQTELVLGKRPITEWSGNVTISLEGIHLADVTERWPGMHFLTSYYRGHRASIDPRSLSEAAELQRMRHVLPSRFRLADCSQLPHDYYASIRRELALEHRLESCRRDVPFRLVAANNSVDATDDVIFSGDFYRLVRSNPLQGDGPNEREVQER